MSVQTLNIENSNKSDYPTTYREVQINGTLYRITSTFKGEKELGPTLEKLAVQHVLDKIGVRTNEVLMV